MIGRDVPEHALHPFRRPSGVPRLDPAPFGRRLERDHRLEHREGSGIGARVGAPRLAEHVIDLGELLDRPVAHLQELLRLGDRDSGHGGRHVEERPLVERRHELRSEVREHRHRDHDEGRGAADHRPFPPQRPADDRLVDPHQEAADGMRLLGPDAADDHRVDRPAEPRGPELEAPHAREEHAQRGVERDHEDRRHQHGERLGVGERLEHPPFLRLERQHRKERHRDHEQREEARRRHLLDRLEDELRDGRASIRRAAPARASCASAPRRRSPRPPARRSRSRCPRAT